MDFQNCFPVWEQLTNAQQNQILSTMRSQRAPKGAIVHNGKNDCSGFLMVKNGRLRAYILSDEGREITLYRLFDRDVCLLSASCMLRSIQFEITVEAEKDTEFWLIPAETYKGLMEDSAAAANYTNEILAGRFSEVMWLMEQIMWKSMDKRVADFLLEESVIENTSRLHITHETIAKHLGTHREVITRMLRYLQEEGMVLPGRGMIELTDVKKLRELRDSVG